MRAALAWGGGVGSLLALDALRAAGDDVTLVHVPAPEDAWRHLPRDVVRGQAAALGLPLVLAEGSTELRALADALARLAPERVAFGYLRGEEYEQFHLVKALQAAGTPAILPVRHLPPGEAARQLVEAGHRAFVRAAAAPFDASTLGRFLDPVAIDELDGVGGRRGWASLRGFAMDGPAFRHRVAVAAGGVEAAGDGWRLGLACEGC